MFLCQHLGVAPEKGRIHEIKCQIPHVSTPNVLTSAKVAKQEAYMRDTMVIELQLHSIAQEQMCTLYMHTILPLWIALQNLNIGMQSQV